MRNWRKLLGIVSIVAVFGLLISAIVNAQALEDWMRLRDYTPPTAIAKIASEDKLTPKAEHILYVTHPVLDSSPSDFSQRCPQAEQTIVLGCYHSGVSAFTGDSFLYVKAIADTRLNGVEEVTTAHEMLHAAYDRLSVKEKNRVDAMLLDYYNNGLKDQRIISTLNSYKKTEPNDVVNEMHSIFGTEVPGLPSQLESYYTQYFTDRTAVVDFAQNYEGEFTKRTTLLDADLAQMKELKADIQERENTLQSQLAEIQSQRASVERSDDQATVDAYNAKVSAYNAGVAHLRSQINQYNQLVEDYNQIATELRSLQNSLSSQLSTQ